MIGNEQFITVAIILRGEEADVVIQAGCEEEQSGSRTRGLPGFQETKGHSKQGVGCKVWWDASVHTGEGMETCKLCLM